MLDEDSSNQSGGSEDPIPYLIGLLAVLTLFVWVNTEISLGQLIVAWIATLLMGAIGYYGFEKYEEAIDEYIRATASLLLATKWANRKYRSKNPCRPSLQEVRRARVSAHREQAEKIVRTGVTRVKSHPSTPFEHPNEQPSEEKQLEAPDDE